MNEIRFEDYVGMIRKTAHRYSKMYNIEYEEIEGEGFEIYCKALETFDPTKSSFSTHLFNHLKRLNRFCKKYVDTRSVEVSDESLEYFESTNGVYEHFDLIEDARTSLSSVAFKVFEWILGRTWDKKGVRTPSPFRASLELGISRGEARKAWEEIGKYWKYESCPTCC